MRCIATVGNKQMTARMNNRRFVMTGLIRFNGVPAVRWSPFGLHGVSARGASDIDRALDSLASQVFGDGAGAGELRADVRENANAYVVQFDVPGVAKDDITVDVDEKSVRVEATFKRESADGEKAVLSERAAGSLSRVFRLPLAVDAEQASARHEHGVLTLTLPKKNVATQKRLEIN
jgi:HSP20 family protein